jgi:hypothetical protein
MTVRSLAEFVEVVRKIREQWRRPDEYLPLWFRGHGDASKELTPRLYRKEAGDVDEDELRYEFERRAIQFPLSHVPSSQWEWYFLMQHYRIPTRLLDWSEGALLALHFALSSSDETDAAVWVLDAWWLNRLVLRRSGVLRRVRSAKLRYLMRELLPDPRDERTKWIRRYLPLTYAERVLPRLPAAIQPPHIDRRIAAQLSAFTIHGRLRIGLEKLVGAVRNAHLAKIHIPEDCVGPLRRHLSLCGVGETTVFADLEGLGRELTYTFSDEPIAKLVRSKYSANGGKRG